MIRQLMLSTSRTILLVVAALSLVPSRADAATIDKNYAVSGYASSNSFGEDNLNFWGGYAGSSIPPSAWTQGPVTLGSFSQYGPNPNNYPGGNFPDIVYKDVPFTITLSPTQVVPPTIPGYTYSVTGPQYDGVVIHGVVNGVLSSTGPSDLVATFQAVTPFDMASYFSQLQGVTYHVDPSLSNPFPLDQLILPTSLDLNLNGFTDVTASIVPEPSTILAFLPLGAALLYRRRKTMARSAQ